MPGLSDAEYAEMQQLAADPSVEPSLKARAQKALAQRVQEQAASQMDPSMPLLPQALAMQPATTHPEGDDKAREEWISDPHKASLLGAKYWYEPPIAVARKDLSDPTMAQALNPHPDQPVTPEELAGLTEDDPLYQAYADHKWRDTAEQSAKDGTVAYRYAKAPWMHADNGMGTLQTLGMKLIGSAVPLTDLKNAMVLGVDKSVLAGAGRRLAEHFNPDSKAENARVEEEHPVAVAGGGVLGALSGWGSATAAYEAATGARVLAPLAAEGAGVLRNAAAGLIGGAAGGALAQGAEEGVNTAANALEGAPAASAVPEGAAGRIGGSAIGGGVLGGIAGTLGGIAGAARRYIGGRHGGAVNEFERAGGQLKTLDGPVPSPAVAQAEAEGAKLGVNPVDLHADRLAPKIEESTTGHVENTIGQAADENAAHYATPEGQQKLPMTNTVAKAVDLVREGTHVHPETGELSDLADGGANGRIRGVLNHEIAGVSPTPVPGAVPVSPAEAEHLLAPHHKDDLIAQLSPKESGAAAPSAGPASAGSAATVPLSKAADMVGMKPEMVSGYAAELQKAGLPVTPNNLHIQKTLGADKGAAAIKGGAKNTALKGMLNPDMHASLDAEVEGFSKSGLAAQVTPKMQIVLDQLKSGVKDRRTLADSMPHGHEPHYELEQLEKQGLIKKLTPEERAPGSRIDAQYKLTDKAPAAAEPAPSVKNLDPQKVKDLRANGDVAAKKLSNEELDAIRSYTSRRGEKVGTPAWNSATRKLRIENPTDAGPLYHGTRMSSGEIAQVLDDGSFALNRPTSLSFNKDLSDAFAHGREARGDKVMFEVQQLNEGTNLMSPHVGIGRSGMEREINVSKPTTFDVVGHHVDDEGTTHIQLAQKPRARAEKGKGSLRDALEARGIDKVYLVPKRYDAREMQGTAKALRNMSDTGSQDPGRDAFSKLHAAVLQDRDARTLNGVPGGWGAKKAEQSAALGAAKTEKRLAMQPSVGKPKGDAFQPLTQYSRETVGQYPLTKALRASAGRAGVTPELEQLRQLGVLQNLRGMANFGNISGTTRSPLSPGPLIDFASIRAYPALKALGGPINPVHLAAGSSLLNAGEREADREENQ